MIARRVAIAAVSVVLVVLLASRLPPVRTIAMTGTLVPELLGVDFQRLPGLEPTVTTTTYGAPSDRMDVWVPATSPAGDRLMPGVVLALGIHPQPIDHPDVTRVARAISRLGVVVGIPDSTALRELRVTPAEPPHLADAVLALGQWPGVDDERLGLAGFSAGASIGLVAAADERIAARLRFVSSFGGYAQAERLLVDVATRTAAGSSGIRAWQPDPRIRSDVLELMVGTLGDAGIRDRLRVVLEPIVTADEPPTGPDHEHAAQFAGDALQIYLLFSAASRADAERAIAELSPELQRDLGAISPLTFAHAIRSPVFLLHGRSDNAIPVEHADTLAAALDPRLARYTRFGHFGHEQPGLDGLDAARAADVWELALYLRDIVAAVLE